MPYRPHRLEPTYPGPEVVTSPSLSGCGIGRWPYCAIHPPGRRTVDWGASCRVSRGGAGCAETASPSPRWLICMVAISAMS